MNNFAVHGGVYNKPQRVSYKFSSTEEVINFALQFFSIRYNFKCLVFEELYSLEPNCRDLLYELSYSFRLFIYYDFVTCYTVWL